jgi:type VI secretion system protein ImpA
MNLLKSVAAEVRSTMLKLQSGGAAIIARLDASRLLPEKGNTMKALPEFLLGPADQQALDDVLAPLAVEAPCGPAARYDPVFTEIRLLREEDDPSLPMGQWERPLRRADWPRIESECLAMLTTRSKDLQIAAWLVESWLRQRGLVGLFHGLRLLDTLLRNYWTSLHPVIDDDYDCEARLAPLEWLNESLSASVRTHAALIKLEGGKPPCITLADWERMTAQDMAAPVQDTRRNVKSDVEVPLTRADIFAAAEGLGTELAMSQAAVYHSLDYLHAMIAFLEGQLGAEAPNLSKLHDTLEAVQRVLSQMLPEEETGVMSDEALIETGFADSGQAALPSAGAAVPAAVAATANWRNRGEAYATLEALVDYLMLIEPHSPVPFLIRRAVNWGRMPLPEVIAEIIREEGDLNRLVNVLGLKL